MGFLSCLLFWCAADWQISQTEVFQPLELNEVIVAEDGSVYVLNFQEAQVRHYSPEGALLGLIGKKGKGPGEFIYPTQFFFQEPNLYVFDFMNTNVSVFTKDGAFVERLRVPQRGVRLQKVQNGWMYGTWDVFGLDGPAELIWVDEAFKHPKTILEIADPGIDGGMMVSRSPEGTLAQFGPLSAKPQMFTSPDLSRVYLTDPMAFEIKIIDVAKKQVVGAITRDEPKIPFDTDWADAEFKRRKEEGGPDFPRNVEKLYPDTFPAIRNVIVTPDHILVVNRWKGRPDATSHPIALDPTGKVVPMPYSWEVLQRLAGIVGDWAYVLTFDGETEEAGIARCRVSELSDFVASHPIEFDGQGGREIRISM